MKSETRLKIIKIVRESGPTRPFNLARELEISPQALHRQLKKLMDEGILVQQGKPPTTRYALSGIPDFSDALKWIFAPKIERSPTDVVCETRDVFTARLSPLKHLTKNGLNTDTLPLFISNVGEIGNNCFDHNLGQWRDVPGCWFEVQVTGNKLWVCIADRGQGIYSSLSKVDSKIPNEQAAMSVAFEKYMSGRSPEKRGNGLKYVKRTIVGEPERGLACVSGKGRISFGDWADKCDQVLEKSLSKARGTLTLMVWRLG